MRERRERGRVKEREEREREEREMRIFMIHNCNCGCLRQLVAWSVMMRCDLSQQPLDRCVSSPTLSPLHLQCVQPQGGLDREKICLQIRVGFDQERVVTNVQLSSA